MSPLRVCSPATGDVERRADGGAGGRPEPRYADAERGRQLQLHAGRELQRHRLVHLPGRRREDVSNVATVTITVNPVNDAPVADDDSLPTDEDTALNVAAPGVLGNDTDVDGDSLTATS